MKRIFLICLIAALTILSSTGFYVATQTDKKPLEKPIIETVIETETTIETETEEEETEPVTETESTTAPSTEPIVITEAWFDDALFIGDSRTAGMKTVRRLGNADYFCKDGMSTLTALSWTTSDNRFYDKTLRFVLSNFEYKKIFIELGINECGYDHELVIDAYQDIIDLIYEYQTDPIIIVQSVIPVSKWNASDERLSLERISNLNKLIYEMAKDNALYYIDTNEFAADENGYLRSDISHDGCHLNEIGSKEWIEFIIEKVQNLIV